MADWQRTKTCGELRAEDAGQTVTLNGWVRNWRDHAGLVFIDLFDRWGRTQVVFDQSADPKLQEQARDLRSEFVIAVRGEVRQRPEGNINPDYPTGAIEVRVRDLWVLNTSETPKFELGTEDDPAGEALRLQYRFLDLRRPAMQQVMIARHQIVRAMREYLYDREFVEIETPILGRSTPEGARDYLVPSRVKPGTWFALPQSPQLYKQMLMVSGYERYFQVARCFRDEDLRANRQPEFTQLDIEMAFVDENDVMGLIEGVTANVFEKTLGIKIGTPFTRLTWDDAMRRFGSDKPDQRYGMEIVDVTALAHQTTFKVFTAAPCVRGLCAVGGGTVYTRKMIDELIAFAGEHGAKGLAWIKVEDGGKLNSSIVKFFSEEQQAELVRLMAAKPGDLLVFVADEYAASHAPLAAVRARLARELKLIQPGSYHFSWVVDFPMFEWDAEGKRWSAMHHPFTNLKDGHWEKLDADPGAVRAKAYDLVINGEEAAGGTIRVHRPDLQRKLLEVMGMTAEQAELRFGFLMQALRYGAPPHGGIAAGVDRWVMLLTGTDNIRDCIAFPKTQQAADLLTGAPAPVDPLQLRELGLR